MSGHPRDLHAFALGDLTGDAQAAAERHVASCRRCRSEVRRLREEHAATVDALPRITPSAAERERTLAAARTAMTGAAARHAATTAGRAVPRRANAWAGWAAAALVALAAVTVTWERHAAWRASEGERAIVAAWLTRQDVTTWPLPAAPGMRSPGSVMVADDGVVLVVMRSPARAGTAYRAWGVTSGGAVALGDVPRTVLRVPAAGYDELVVSVEPKRATTAPTEPLGAAPIARGRPGP